MEAQRPLEKLWCTQEQIFAAARASQDPRLDLDNFLCDPILFQAALSGLRRAKGRNSPGLDGVTLHQLSKEDQRQLVDELCRELREGVYSPGPVKLLKVAIGPERVRRLSILSLRDRLVQLAIHQLVVPIVESELYSASYASRPNFGPVRALEDVAAALRSIDGPCFVVRADVHRFFGSIPHRLILRLVRRHVRGRRLIRTLKAHLKAWSPEPGVGLPEGAPLSPVLANWFLAGVDEFFMRRRTVFYARYMDDLLIAVPGDRERALQVLDDLHPRLAKLGLRLNDEKSKVYSLDEGFEYLGVRFTRRLGEIETHACERSLERIKDRIAFGEIASTEETTRKLRAATAAWVAYYGPFDQAATQVVLESLEETLGGRLGCDSSRYHAHLGEPTDTTGTITTTNTQPTRAVGVREHSSVGGEVYSGRDGTGCSASQTLYSDLDNEELGEVRTRHWAMHEFWGSELQRTQMLIHACRVRRRAMRTYLTSSRSRSVLGPSVDAVLSLSPAHQEVLSQEHAAGARAREANQELALVRSALRDIDSEMRARCLKEGFMPEPGLLHLMRRHRARPIRWVSSRRR